MRKIVEEQKEHAIQEAASSSCGTAQVLRAVSIDRRRLQNTDTQTDGPTIQIYDISMEGRKEEFARDLDMATEQHEEREQ